MRIDRRMRPSEAARWFRSQGGPFRTLEGEAAYLADAKRCSVDHGNGRQGERHRVSPNLIDGSDRDTARPVDFYHQAGLPPGRTLRIA